MHLVAGFSLFVIGFFMFMGALALLIGGDVVFQSGKKIPKRVGRKTAVALLAFFPLVFAGRFALQEFDPEKAVPPAALYWPIALLCLACALTFLLRGMEGKPRRVVSVSTSPTVSFDSGPVDDAPGSATLTFDGPAAAPAKSASKSPRRGKAASAESDPFNFS